MDLGGFDTLLVEERGAALVVTVNRPAALNALSVGVVSDLERLCEQLAGVGESGEWPVRGVVLTGAGEKAFVAGADIREMGSMSVEDAEAYARRMDAVTVRLERLPVPVVAAVGGFALGGGCELALACDVIYAAQGAVFGQPEVGLGLIPGFGGCVRLARRVGPGHAREMIFSGRRVAAPEAESFGLVDRVFPDLQAAIDAAVAFVEEVAGAAPTAVRTAKATLGRVANEDVEAGLSIEATAFGQCFVTADAAEGIDAFIAKRAANFPGR